MFIPPLPEPESVKLNLFFYYYWIRLCWKSVNFSASGLLEIWEEEHSFIGASSFLDGIITGVFSSLSVEDSLDVACVPTWLTSIHIIASLIIFREEDLRLGETFWGVYCLTIPMICRLHPLQLRSGRQFKAGMFCLLLLPVSLMRETNPRA